MGLLALWNFEIKIILSYLILSLGKMFYFFVEDQNLLAGTSELAFGEDQVFSYGSVHVNRHCWLIYQE